MDACPRCGASLEQRTPFCAHCGADLSVERSGETQPITVLPPGDVPPVSPPATRPLPPPPAPSAAPAFSGAVPQLDWVGLLRGNWVGAGLVVVVTLGVAGVLATVMAALGKPVDFGVDNSLTLVSSILNGSFGAPLVARFRSDGQSIRASVAAVPLTVTVISLAAGALTFRRVVAGYQRARDAVADAVRAAALFAVALTIVALVFRADSREFGRGWGNELAQLFDVRIRFGPSIPGSLILGFVTMLVTLLGVVWVRRDLWPERRRGLAEVLVPPLYGLATFAVLLPVAGAIGLVLMLLTGDSIQHADPTRHDFWASASLIFGLLASGGYWLVTLGAGGTFGEHGSDGGTSSSDYHHLGHAAAQDPGLWAAPLVTLLVLGVATVVVARKTRSHQAVQTSLLVWVSLLLVTTPLAVRLTSVHAIVSAGGSIGPGVISARGAIGVNDWWAALLLPLVALVCSVAVAWVRGALDLTRVREAGRTLQADPGRRPDQRT